MSREAVEQVIGKAMLDEKFRAAIFANPDEAYKGYDLTEEEVAALKAIDAETVESMAGALDERVSKADFAGLALALTGGGMPAVDDGTIVAI